MSDSDTDSDESIGENLQILISNLDKSDYDGHLKIIKRAKDEGELDILRDSREKFAASFPLTEELWLEWIDDEKKLIEDDTGHETLIEPLFERGVKDYLSPKLWFEYIQYAIRYLGQEDGLKRFRALCERAIQKIGIHPEHGAQIWEVYRETEKMIESDDKKEKIANLFKRQCSLPIYQLEETYKEFKQFNQSKWKMAKIDYDKAVLKLKEIEKFESEIRQTEKNPKEHLDAWKEYIRYELKKGDPVRIEFLYERATSKLCLNSALWTEYISWARKIKSPNLDQIVIRATRNCTWDSSLWVTRIKIAENFSLAHDLISEIHKNAIEAMVIGSQVTDFVNIWKVYIFYLKRQIQNVGATDQNKEAFRAGIRAAVKFMEFDLVNKFDESVASEKFFFEKFGAKVEAVFCGEMPRTRSKWQKLLKTSIGRDAVNWTEFAQLEVQNDEYSNARKIFHQGITFANTNLDLIYAVARDFEILHGSVDDIDLLEEKIQRKLKEVEKKEERETFEKDRAAKRVKNDKNKIDQKGKNKKFQPLAFVKQVDGNLDGTPPRKKQKTDTETAANENNDSFAMPGFKMPQLPVKMPKANDNKTPPSSSNGESKKEEVISKHAESPEEKERTVFISNLSYSLYQPEKKVKQLLLGCGEIEVILIPQSSCPPKDNIKSLRLVKKGALFRGYGYVTFVSIDGAKNALLRDRNHVDGRPAFITAHTDKDSEKPKKGIFIRIKNLFDAVDLSYKLLLEGPNWFI